MNRLGTSVRSALGRRPVSMARSIRRWSWTGCTSGTEEPRRRALEETFEEPLDGGQWRHGRSRSLPAGSPRRSARPARSGTERRDHPPERPGTHVEGHRTVVRYTLAPLSGARARTVRALPRGPDDRNPDRIVLRAMRHPLHLRIRGQAYPPQGREGALAWTQELRPRRQDVDRGGDGGGAERCGPGSIVAPARRLPQDLQLLHVVPAVHVPQLLERGRGAVPVVRAARHSRNL